MKPEVVLAAAALLKRREALVKARGGIGHDQVVKIASCYKTAGFFDITYLDHEETRQVLDLLIDRADALLDSMSVELPAE